MMMDMERVVNVETSVVDWGYRGNHSLKQLISDLKKK